MKYQMVIGPLDEADGGGYRVFFPDLPGCISDGESPVEAAANGLDALQVWLDAQQDRGIEAPAPGTASAQAEAFIDGLTEDLDAARKDLDAAQARIRELEQRQVGPGFAYVERAFVARGRRDMLRTG